MLYWNSNISLHIYIATFIFDYNNFLIPCNIVSPICLFYAIHITNIHIYLNHISSYLPRTILFIQRREISNAKAKLCVEISKIVFTIIIFYFIITRLMIFLRNLMFTDGSIHWAFHFKNIILTIIQEIYKIDYI